MAASNQKHKLFLNIRSQKNGRSSNTTGSREEIRTRHKKKRKIIEEGGKGRGHLRKSQYPWNFRTPKQFGAKDLDDVATKKGEGKKKAINPKPSFVFFFRFFFLFGGF